MHRNTWEQVGSRLPVIIASIVEIAESRQNSWDVWRVEDVGFDTHFDCEDCEEDTFRDATNCSVFSDLSGDFWDWLERDSAIPLSVASQSTNDNIIGW